MKIKKIACLILTLMITLSICGCGEKEFTLIPLRYSTDTQQFNTLGVVASVGDYSLSFDGTLGFPVVTKSDSAKRWDSSLQNSFSASSIFVDVYDPEYESFVTVKSIDCVVEGRVKSEAINNGVRVTYFFDQYEIYVPVYYKLDENGLKVKVIPSEIYESNYTVTSVAVCPYLCSSSNVKSKNNYLYIPSGSGALMYTDNRGESRTYKEEVYGIDLASEEKWLYNNQEQIYLPVFGAVDGTEAMYGIITSGAESSAIGAHAGDSALGYSGVYPVFNIRSYNTVQVNIGGTTGLKEFIRLADKRNSETFEVQYSILSGENASYNGIAAAYRNYLGLQSGAKNKQINLTLLGGVMADRSALGIPYTTFSPSTTIEQAAEIVSQIYETTKTPMNIRLLGFGNTGLDTDKVAGGFKINGKLGSKSKIKDLKSLCDEISSDLFMDYDILQFVNSGKGFSKRSDAAVDTTNYRVKKYTFDISLRNVDTTKKSKYLLSRNNISKAVDKTLDSVRKYGFDGISLDTLGRMAYSDFNSTEYYGKGKMDEDVTNALNKVTDSNVKLLTKSANDYAAKVSSYIDSIPTSSTNSDALDVDIPFYGIVFSGCKENSVMINLSSEPRKKFLEAIKIGSGLSFVLANDINSDVIGGVFSAYISADYESNKDNINGYYTEAKDFLNSVSGVSVKDYTILKKGVTRTIFENGVTVYVNETVEDVVCGKNLVKAMSFKVG